MGIRPTFYILVGIDDAKSDDPRRSPIDDVYLEEILYLRELTEDEYWKDKEDRDLFSDYLGAVVHPSPGHFRNLSDGIYNPYLSGDHIKNIIGLKIHIGPHDDMIIRALATIDEKYLDSGYARIPTIDPDKHKLMYKHYRYNETDVKCNRFVKSYFENIPTISRMDWKRAQHYLRLIGWNIPEEDLRYLLVWDWS